MAASFITDFQKLLCFINMHIICLHPSSSKHNYIYTCTINLPRSRKLIISSDHCTANNTRPAYNFFQKVGTILDEWEQVFECNEKDPPPVYPQKQSNESVLDDIHIILNCNVVCEVNSKLLYNILRHTTRRTRRLDRQ